MDWAMTQAKIWLSSYVVVYFVCEFKMMELYYAFKRLWISTLGAI